MPPHLQYTQSATQTNTSSEELQTNLKKEQLNCFAKHCERFYYHSLSTCSINENDIIASEEVMNALNNLLSGHTITLNSKILKCGIHHNITTDELLEYTRIRDDIRRKAHEEGMKERKIILMRLLNDKIMDRDNDDCEGLVKEFVQDYKHNIGIHPILAGIRHLLEMQIRHNEIVIVWKFNITSITECIDTGSNGSIFISQVITMLNSFLIRVLEEEKQRDETIVCWKVHSLNKRKMRQLLSIIPSKKDLYAKPTGEVFETNMVRICDNDGLCGVFRFCW